MRVPLTNLRDNNKGGAPIYIGGDRHASETTPSPPSFSDDTDQYMTTVPSRRGLLTIAHFPPAGASTVDFVNLYMRNNSSTQSKYVNVFLAADISAQIRVSSVQTAYPRFADVLVTEADTDAVISATLNDQNEIEIHVVQNAQFSEGTIPLVQFDPQPTSNLNALVNLDSSGSIQSISVVNPTAHSYTTAPQVTISGGAYKELGFYQQTDEDTTVYGSDTSGTLRMFGLSGRTQFSNNIASPGNVLVANNEIRVIRSINHTQMEITIDRPFTTSNVVFEQWTYIPILSASDSSLMRIGPGNIRNASLGFNSILCSSPHNLCTGDYIVYAHNSTYYSHRVTVVVNDHECMLDSNVALLSTSSASWYYLYHLSETQPGVSNTNLIRMITYTKTSYDPGKSLDILGLGGRNIFIKNKNFLNEAGSYYDSSMSDDAKVVLFGKISQNHNERQETLNAIAPHHTLEIVLKQQPAPEVQVLAGFPMNGGLATEVGKRPILAINERGCNGVSSDVVFWGYYVRYHPESSTNFTQAINV